MIKMKASSIKIGLIFQECLEAAQRGENIEQIVSRYPDHADELLQRLEMVRWLEENETLIESRPGFIPASRQRLVDRLKRESAAEATRPRDPHALKAFQVRRFWQVLNTISVTVLILFMVLIGMQGYSFAQTSIPGDMLYGVKILGEKMHLEATFSPAKKAELNVEYAGRRSSEIVELIFEGRFDYLTSTSMNLKEHVLQADRLLTGLQASNPSLSDYLSDRLENTFISQNLVLDLLIQSVPLDERLGVEEAIALETR
jgi:hypothetical protein